MKKFYTGIKFAALLFGLLILTSCSFRNPPAQSDLVPEPEKLDTRVQSNIQSILSFALDQEGRISDSSSLNRPDLLDSLYEARDYSPLWSAEGKWTRAGDSLYSSILNSKEYGLFPADYHRKPLSGIRFLLLKDSAIQYDAAVWARADLLLTDAFYRLANDIRFGRLRFDTLIVRKDTIQDHFYNQLFLELQETGRISELLAKLEPANIQYRSLKQGLKQFLDSVIFTRYTYLPYPINDSASFLRLLKHRLFELDLLPSASTPVDSIDLASAIKKFQSANKLKATGIYNEATAYRMNFTEWEKFKQIAITMDKTKWLPDTIPATYLWVNIPSYLMQVVESDTIRFRSRIIVGTAKTRTPELSSEITNFITFPQWTVPYSIVFGEMLPKIQKDLKYLDKQDLMVVDRNDNVIDPASIDWSKLNKNKFPYQLKQRQGDNNSLGILKFNFKNKYSVYLHDTNSRWLFQKSERALSHGCVRVQQWKDLAKFLIRNDTLKIPADTLNQYLARQEKRTVTGFQKLPLYIRYYTCESVNGRIRFYDDIYAEDKYLREKYFSDKSIN